MRVAIFFMGLLLIVAMGCANKNNNSEWGYEASPASPELLKNIEEIKGCLDQTNTAWNAKVDLPGTIIVRFDNKNEDEIFALTSEYNISASIYYKTGDIIFIELDINKNLPAEKICNLLNSEMVSIHYVEQYMHPN